MGITSAIFFFSTLFCGKLINCTSVADGNLLLMSILCPILYLLLLLQIPVQRFKQYAYKFLLSIY